MGPHHVQHPRQHTVLVLVTVVVVVVMTTATVRAGVLVPMIGMVIMGVAVVMIVMRVAARYVHGIQDALKKAFPHVTRDTHMQYWCNNEQLK